MNQQEKQVDNCVFNSKWTFWYEERDTSYSTEEWGNQIQNIKTFDNIKDFWTLYRNVNTVTSLAFQTMYHVFKEGIKPIWEDKANQNGGAFVFFCFDFSFIENSTESLRFSGYRGQMAAADSPYVGRAARPYRRESMWS